MATEQTALEVVDPKLMEELVRLVKNAGEGSTGNRILATGFIQWALKNTNYIGAATSCPNMIPGFELAFTRVDINPDPKFKECYRQSDGGLSLTKTGLEKIQKGAGIRMDPKLTRKLDNGQDSLFAIYEFVGYYRDFDSTICPLKGTRKLDLHDGSAEIEKIRVRQKSQTAGDAEINQLRRFIDEHTETKARLRAIRSFQIKSSYTEEELRRPFTCVRLIRTARCEDPVLAHDLALMAHKEYVESERLLFGGGSSHFPQLTGEKGSEPIPESAEPFVPSPNEAKGEPVTTATPTAQTNAAATETQTAEAATTPTKAEPYILKSGRSAGKSVAAMADSALSLAVGYYDNLKATTQDEAQLVDIAADRAALLAEVASRAAESQG